MSSANGASLTTSPLFFETDINNNPLAGGHVYTYAAGTFTPLATYTDSTLAVQNTNPVVLDAYGKAQIWLGQAAYKINVTDVNNVQHPDYPIDNLFTPYFPPLINYANDVAASAGGVPVGGMYVSSGVVHIRVS